MKILEFEVRAETADDDCTLERWTELIREALYVQLDNVYVDSISLTQKKEN